MRIVDARVDPFSLLKIAAKVRLRWSKAGMSFAAAGAAKNISIAAH